MSKEKISITPFLCFLCPYSPQDRSLMNQFSFTLEQSHLLKSWAPKRIREGEVSNSSLPLTLISVSPASLFFPECARNTALQGLGLH